MTDSEAVAARTNMVERQLRPSQVRSARLLNAMLNIPREQFVPPALCTAAYADSPIEVAPGRFLLSPLVFGRMVQEAQIREQDRVLDIGCLTGYSSAVIGRLAREVVAIECETALVEQASENLRATGDGRVRILHTANLAEGCAEFAPYDVILCEGSVDFVPEGLKAQMADGGRLLAIVRSSAALGQAMLYVRSGPIVSGRPLFEAMPPTLPGFAREPDFVFA